MKISNSKKQLAKIIHENGGWRDGAEFAAQDSVKDSCPCRICFYSNKPKLKAGARRWFDGNNGIVGGAEGCIHGVNAIPNWHQTILSRDEYFHLYPAPDAKKEFCESVMRSIPEPEIHSKNTALTQVDDIDVVESKPTIEQLAADYRNAKYYADRKQQEADAAEADAEAKLSELVAAGKALGLVLSVVGVAPEPELVVTDWRDLQLGDIIQYVDGDIKDKIGMSGPVVEFDPNATDGMHVRLKCDNGPYIGRLGWPRKWRFIRRP